MITPEQLARSNTEHGHQAAIFCYFNEHKKDYPQLNMLFAIPNGGLRDKSTAAKLKAEGVKSGVSDMFLAWPTKGYHGLFIELKVGKNTPTNEQLKWLDLAYQHGYKAVWVTGWETAVKVIWEYIKI